MTKSKHYDITTPNALKAAFFDSLKIHGPCTPLFQQDLENYIGVMRDDELLSPDVSISLELRQEWEDEYLQSQLVRKLSRKEAVFLTGADTVNAVERQNAEVDFGQMLDSPVVWFVANVPWKSRAGDNYWLNVFYCQQAEHANTCPADDLEWIPAYYSVTEA